MERERKFNILRGIVSGAFLTMETKKELIDFVNELEEAEQEIRNKAIDEFAERMKELDECGEISVFGWNRIVNEIAEQMKGV